MKQSQYSDFAIALLNFLKRCKGSKSLNFSFSRSLITASLTTASSPPPSRTGTKGNKLDKFSANTKLASISQR